GYPAGDLLQNDAAPPLRVVLAEEVKRALHPLRGVVSRRRQIVHGKRLRGDDEQRLQGSGQRLEGPRIGSWRAGGFADGACRRRRDQAERTFHVRSPSSLRDSTPSSQRPIRIGAKGAACSMVPSPARRSSRTARNATACSTRESPSTSRSKSSRRRRRNSARNRSTNCV